MKVINRAMTVLVVVATMLSCRSKNQTGEHNPAYNKNTLEMQTSDSPVAGQPSGYSPPNTKSEDTGNKGSAGNPRDSTQITDSIGHRPR